MTTTTTLLVVAVAVAVAVAAAVVTLPATVAAETHTATKTTRWVLASLVAFISFLFDDVMMTRASMHSGLRVRVEGQGQ